MSSHYDLELYDIKLNYGIIVGLRIHGTTNAIFCIANIAGDLAMRCFSSPLPYYPCVSLMSCNHNSDIGRICHQISKDSNYDVDASKLIVWLESDPDLVNEFDKIVYDIIISDF